MEGLRNVILIIIAFPLAGAIVLIGEWAIPRIIAWFIERGRKQG